MRVLIFHGYLLSGTGSNVYNARLAAALVALGHEVHLLCQERHPEDHPFIATAGDWDAGTLRLHGSGPDGSEPPAPGSAGSCTIYRPNIGGLLPVYVADRYEGVEARAFTDCSDEEVARYVEANVEAVAEVCELVEPEVALANHLVMGPLVLARALAGKVPYAVKVHGSALEYTVKPEPERFLEAAREGLAGARSVLVGSRHTALSLWAAIADPRLPDRTRLGPPGVDVGRFSPREPRAAREALNGLSTRLAHSSGVAGVDSVGSDAFARDEPAAARALARIDSGEGRLVAFVGKLIVSKGVDLLLAAWPLVLERAPDARLVVVGFGAYREGLEALIAALAAGDLEGARGIALSGRALEAQAAVMEHPPSARDAADSPVGEATPEPLHHLLAFFDSLGEEEAGRYLALAGDLGERVTLTGRLDHEEIAELLPACEALVVPSTFPEAFGMVAAEAAACGAFPVSAAHSGLAEVSDALARAIPPQAVPWLSFPLDAQAVRALAACITGWLSADPPLRAQTRAGLVATVRSRWSWEGVARGVIAAGSGDLETLSAP
jgi:glycosyltransferase involved in cell wall biosynthesis